MAQKKPAHKIRLGNIQAAIWANDNGSDQLWFNVTLTRSFNDGNGWKDSSSFRRDDLPIAAKVLDMAYTWIWERQGAASPEEGDA